VATTHIAASSFPVRDSHNQHTRMTSSTDTSLLDILETHGKKFLDSFKPHKAEKNKRKRVDGDTTEAHRSTKLVRFENDQLNSVQDSADDHSYFAEEWTGLSGNTQVDDEYAAEDEASLDGLRVQL
jgi:hypothetical protein